MKTRKYQSDKMWDQYWIETEYIDPILKSCASMIIQGMEIFYLYGLVLSS